MTEDWRDIPGYVALYQVSNLGRVRSLHRTVELVRLGRRCTRRIEGGILQPASMSSGHLSVSLSRDGKQRTHQVHALVLEAFVGPRPGTHIDWQGCHADGNPANNNLTNLRWDTRSANEMDKIGHGRSNRGVRNRAAKLTEEKVREIRVRISSGESSDAIADRYGVSRALINAIKGGRAWGWL